MRRLLPAVLVLALLAGTAAAFAVTEGLKTTTSPVAGTKLARKAFSPVCGCDSRTASVSFRLRRPDRVTVEVVNSAGRAVALLQDGKVKAGEQTFSWDGTAAGKRAPDGAYRFRISLDDADRVITLPNPVALDTRPPRIAVIRARPAGKRLLVRYRVSEPAHGMLLVGTERVLFTRFQRRDDTMAIALDALAAGGRNGEILAAAQDTAGNVSRPVQTGGRVAGGRVTGWPK